MLKGTGISDGIGLGKAIIYKSQKIKLEKNKIKDVTLEKEKFYKAIKEVEKEIEDLLEKISGTEKEIMQAYLLILQDPNLIQKTIEIIEKEKWDAAYATEIGFNEIIKEFEKVDDTYISERSKDIEDMKKKIIAKIIGKEEINLSKVPSNTILVAKELSTSDIAKLDFKNIEGIITEVGGMNSHMAIMARTHEIPSSVGVNKITQNIKRNDVVAINGKTGEIFVNPSKKEYKNFEEIKEKIKKEKNELENYKNQDSITKDGHEVKVLANIGMPDDVKIVIQNTAEGVGLFRSEFLYMNSENFPTENEQFEAYKKVVLKLKNKEVIIRTLDIGGDKDLKYMKLPKEDNPFLGYRAIRICLDDINLFKVQLRAILKASAFGNMAIMIPMISSLEELRKTKEIINEVKEELREKKIKFDENIKIGIMIEIPAAALIANELAKECDFFSIGTNDLIQYTVAVERGNKKIANLYTHFHPAVIRLIKKAIEGAHKNHILCGMCGEAAGDATFIPLLIGLGLDEFSMNANKVLNVRKLIRKLDFKECQKLADEVLKLATSDEVEKLFVLMNRLKAQGVGIIFVTHFLEQVYAVCDRITVLRNGELVGEYETKDLPRVMLVAKMMGKDFDDLADIKGDHKDKRITDAEPVIEAKGLSHKGTIKPFDITINKGEVIGLTGLLGSGRSELVRAIYGADKADTGTLKVKGKEVKINTPLDAMKLGMAYLPEDRKAEGIIADLSVRENIIIALQAKRGMFHPLSKKEMEDAADKYIKLLQIKTASRETPIKSLSGGNQQKVILGRWLLTNPDYLILDEPTRGIDIGTKTEIQKLVLDLADQGMAVTFISSEVEEMLRTCSRMAVLRDGQKVGELEEDELSQSGVMKAIAGGDDK